jgi:ribosomal protein S18 acetylase RimI-like enzyme
VMRIAVRQGVVDPGFGWVTYGKRVAMWHEGEIVGRVDIVDCVGAAELRNVRVEKDFRRKGIATKILKKALQLYNKDLYSLDVWVGNHAAQHLYAKLGFERADQYGDILTMEMRK